MGSARQRANRLSPEDRRRQLLDCAIRVFGRRGLGRGGHAEVASEAGGRGAHRVCLFQDAGGTVRGRA